MMPRTGVSSECCHSHMPTPCPCGLLSYSCGCASPLKSQARVLSCSAHCCWPFCPAGSKSTADTALKILKASFGGLFDGEGWADGGYI
jgi:hypothetical protein